VHNTRWQHPAWSRDFAYFCMGNWISGCLCCRGRGPCDGDAPQCTSDSSATVHTITPITLPHSGLSVGPHAISDGRDLACEVNQLPSEASLVGRHLIFLWLLEKGYDADGCGVGTNCQHSPLCRLLRSRATERTCSHHDKHKY